MLGSLLTEMDNTAFRGQSHDSSNRLHAIFHEHYPSENGPCKRVPFGSDQCCFIRQCAAVVTTIPLARLLVPAIKSIIASYCSNAHFAGGPNLDRLPRFLSLLNQSISSEEVRAVVKSLTKLNPEELGPLIAVQDANKRAKSTNMIVISLSRYEQVSRELSVDTYAADMAIAIELYGCGARIGEICDPAFTFTASTQPGYIMQSGVLKSKEGAVRELHRPVLYYTVDKILRMITVVREACANGEQVGVKATAKMKLLFPEAYASLGRLGSHFSRKLYCSASHQMHGAGITLGHWMETCLGHAGSGSLAEYAHVRVDFSLWSGSLPPPLPTSLPPPLPTSLSPGLAHVRVRLADKSYIHVDKVVPTKKRKLSRIDKDEYVTQAIKKLKDAGAEKDNITQNAVRSVCNWSLVNGCQLEELIDREYK